MRKRMLVTWIICVILIPTGLFWMPEPINTVNFVKGEGTHINGKIINTTWTIDGSPYIIESNAFNEPSDWLIINPGVKVLFNGSYQLLIKGALYAQGTNTQPIIFSAYNSNTPGYWKYIKFDTSADTSSYIKNCVIRYAEIGIYENELNSIGNESGSVKIEYNTLTDNSRVGIICEGSSPVIKHNIIDRNGLYGIYIKTYAAGYPGAVDGNPLIRNNSLKSGLFGYQYGVENDNSNQSFAIDAKYNAWGHYTPAKNQDYYGNVSVTPYINIDVRGGYIDDNTSWESGDISWSELRLITPVFVEEGSTLKIIQEIGAEGPDDFYISFDPNVDLVVKGKLLIEGLSRTNFIISDNNSMIYFFQTNQNNMIYNVTIDDINSIYIYASKVSIYNNTIKNGVGHGVYLGYSNNNLILEKNYIHNNSNYGIYQYGDGTITITNNTFENNKIGIDLEDDGTIEIKNNIIQSNGIGIYNVWNPSISILNNTIRNNVHEGIYFWRANPVIQYNHIYNNDIGIKIEPNSNPTIKYNNIYSNANFSIFSNKSITAEECYWGHKAPFDNDNNAPSDANFNVFIKDPYYLSSSNIFSTRLDLNWNETTSPLFDSYLIYRKSTKSGDTNYKLFKKITLKSKYTYIDRDLYHNEDAFYTYYYKVFVHTTIDFNLGVNEESSQVTNKSSGLIAEWNPLFTSSDIAYQNDKLYCTYFIDADITKPNDWQSYFYIFNPFENSVSFNLWYYDMIGNVLGTSPYQHSVNSYQTLEINPDSDLGQPQNKYWEGYAQFTSISNNEGIVGLLKIENKTIMVGETQQLHHSNDTSNFNELYVPYFKEENNFDDWQTDLILYNTDTLNQVTATVTYYDLNGTQLPNPGASYQHVIQSNNVNKWKPSDDLGALPGGSFYQGSIEISSGSTKLIGSVMRYNYSSEKMEIEIMIKNIKVNYTTQIKEYTTLKENKLTRMYLKNTGGFLAAFNVTYFDTDGNVISNGGQSVFNHNISAHAVYSWIPSDDLGGSNNYNGTAKITSENGPGIVGIAIQNINEYDSNASASIPLKDFSSDSLWTPYFDEDSGYDTSLFLVNTNLMVSLNVTISYYALSGSIIDSESKSLYTNASVIWSPDDNVNIYPSHPNARGNILMSVMFSNLFGNILILDRELYP